MQELDTAKNWLFNFLKKIEVDISEEVTVYLAPVIEVIFILILIFAIDFLARKVVVQLLNSFVERSSVTWDDVFAKHNVFKNFAHLAPIVAVDYLVKLIMNTHEDVVSAVDKISDIAFIWVIVLLFSSIINSLLELSKGRDDYFSIAVQSLTQLVRIVIFIVAMISTMAVLLKIPLIEIFGALGALTAIIILVFKDTILGFVASLQLSLSRMVKIGDWLVLPSYNADGPLIELNLMTAKIRNWDKTVTSVPTYALISSAVKNWDGMTQSGVRRIKRSINFDVNSIKFLSPEELEALKAISIIKSYIEQKEIEIENYNKEKGYDTSLRVNGRRQTNIGIFRKYTELYLQKNEFISKEETLMVRQLQPGEFGLPLEIYCFSSEINWVNYEEIQSDIFDHLLAASKEFGLRIHQNPSGSDFSKLIEK